MDPSEHLKSTPLARVRRIHCAGRVVGTCLRHPVCYGVTYRWHPRGLRWWTRLGTWLPVPSPAPRQGHSLVAEMNLRERGQHAREIHNGMAASHLAALEKAADDHVVRWRDETESRMLLLIFLAGCKCRCQRELVSVLPSFQGVFQELKVLLQRVRLPGDNDHFSHLQIRMRLQAQKQNYYPEPSTEGSIEKAIISFCIF